MVSPKASQSGFSHTKPESMTFEVSAGRAVTPQEGQIGARPTSALSPSVMRVIIPGDARSASICLEGAMSFAARNRRSDRERPQGAPGLRSEEWSMNLMARRMFELVEPIGVIPYSADEPNEAMFALGFTNYWDTYFA